MNTLLHGGDQIVKLLAICTFFSCLLSTSSIFAAGFYRWIDADGTVQFSDRVPSVKESDTTADPPSKVEFIEVSSSATATQPTNPASVSGDDNVAIGIMILAESDIDSYVRIAGQFPPVVFAMGSLVDDSSWLANPSGEPPLVDVNNDVLAIARKVSDAGGIYATAMSLPLPFLDIALENFGKVPNVPKLLKGTYDDHFRKVARQWKSFGRPVMLTLLAEFNNFGPASFGRSGLEIVEFGDTPDITGQYGDPTWPDGPERIRDSFIHVIKIFKEEGADNVYWFMYGNTGYLTDLEGADGSDTEWWSHPRYYYPGDEYIDWVGKSVHFTTLDEFRNRFEPAYNAFGEVTKKPIFIPEFSFHESQTDRSTLIRQLLGSYLPSKPRFGIATFYHSPTDVQMGLGFGVPLGGYSGEFKSEVVAWKEVVVKNPYYKNRLGLR